MPVYDAVEASTSSPSVPPLPRLCVPLLLKTSSILPPLVSRAHAQLQVHLAMKGRKYSRSWAEKILIMTMNSLHPSLRFVTSVAMCSMA